MFSQTTLLALAASSTVSASILWDGRLNAYASSAFLNNWSWSNQVGPYQYYIHGSGPVTEYVNLSPKYKNPADSGSKQGIQITIDNTSVWNNDNMLRTELIPQTTAAINKGKVYYHFSMQHTATNVPSPYEEHQVCFFESHFTEMKYGLIDGEQATEDLHLQWMVNSVGYWNVTFQAGVWHNIAYGIDFDGGSVTFYHSTGSAALVKTAGPISVSASSNGADWHLGVLRLPSTTGRTDNGAEDWHFSGVYIEDGDLTTSVAGPGGSKVSSSAVESSTATQELTSSVSSSAKASTSSESTRSRVAAVSTTLSTRVRPTDPLTVIPISSTSAPSVAVVSSSAASLSSVVVSSSTAADPTGACEVDYVYI